MNIDGEFCGLKNPKHLSIEEAGKLKLVCHNDD
jgi:hypothetical protein